MDKRRDTSVFLPRRHEGAKSHEVSLCLLCVFVPLWLIFSDV
ncbi:Uncharacterized protein dnm_048540 [Desulfonema magnum]|uniref:Uncharacterized protein n=1 Tax=Desulfonema magnum TaxID=45655 RepID=A0A975BNJ1_9BACT|nr:Uncharacterized protein dnm_048540 [Desulfonema magnum]